MAEGPVYNEEVDAIKSLPLDVERPDGMCQAMPSADDLGWALEDGHTRLVAGHEVLLSHFLHLLELVNRIKASKSVRATLFGTVEKYHMTAISAADFQELTTTLEAYKGIQIETGKASK